MKVFYLDLLDLFYIICYCLQLDYRAAYIHLLMYLFLPYTILNQILKFINMYSN